MQTRSLFHVPHEGAGAPGSWMANGASRTKLGAHTGCQLHHHDSPLHRAGRGAAVQLVKLPPVTPAPLVTQLPVQLPGKQLNE